MAEFDLEDLKEIYNNPEIIDYLVAKDIIKKDKFIDQYKYEEELYSLQKELSEIQQQLISSGQKVLLIFEGRDAAGKGGSIERITQYLNPKKARVVSLAKPREDEAQQWYFQRYIAHLPQEGELVFFDRSYYNRAVVEPVFEFCTAKQYKSFIKQVVDLENIWHTEGMIVIKLFLSISKKEQEERLESRKQEVLKQWKVGSLDQQAQEKWPVYSKYIKAMLGKTASKNNPWIEIITDDKKIARLAILKVIINRLSEKDQHKIPEIVKMHS
ncbi:polyphosphate kinase 2 [Sphingobacteriaceae bacterium WQ 2009]|uniref:Polyphosphate kinase 2 n=1 Tax=Rhinopithecimicrobium faecis TaxID=2820698 RepID=A0A8T4HB52_9SPHI|nr:polyphosphate kinase 2 [Sphingobacteriaceae bacterium WQ 2009]